MKRIYLRKNQIIGSNGYTDLILTSSGKLKLHSTEGADYDYYDERSDTHYPVLLDMEGTKKTNKNFGKYYYEVEE